MQRIGSRTSSWKDTKVTPRKWPGLSWVPRFNVLSHDISIVITSIECPVTWYQYHEYINVMSCHMISVSWEHQFNVLSLYISIMSISMLCPVTWYQCRENINLMSCQITSVSWVYQCYVLSHDISIVSTSIECPVTWYQYREYINLMSCHMTSLSWVAYINLMYYHMTSSSFVCLLNPHAKPSIPHPLYRNFFIIYYSPLFFTTVSIPVCSGSRTTPACWERRWHQYRRYINLMSCHMI